MKTISKICYPLTSTRCRGYYITPPKDHFRMLKIIETWKRLIKDKGYEEYQFPSIGLVEDLQKQKQHLKIKGEVVELEGGKYLAPTGQMIMYPLIYRDPRIRYFRWQQVSRTYRNESSALSYLKRQKEIKYFYELHSFFESENEVKTQLRYLEKKADKFFELIGIAVQKHYRDEDDRFPGAVSTLAYDTVSSDKKALQILTLHYLKDNFSKALGGPKRYQLCLGFTQRVLGAMKDHYGESLRDVDNPFMVVKITPKGRKTLKMLAQSAEECYDNAYTFSSKIRHVSSGEEVSRSMVKAHHKSLGDMLKKKVTRKISQDIEKFFVEKSCAYKLGLNKEKGKIFYTEKKA